MAVFRLSMPLRLVLVLLVAMVCGGVPATAQDATPVGETATSTPEPSGEVEEPVPTAPDPTVVATESPEVTEPAIDATETPSPPSTPTTAEDDDEPQSVRALAVTLVSPVDPMIVQPACVDGVVIPPTVTPATTDGIRYEVVGTPTPGRNVPVTAVLSGSEFAFGSMPDTWTQVDDYLALANFLIESVPPCQGVVPVPPVVAQATCEGGNITQPTVTLPDNTSIISYAKAGQAVVGRSLIVTADLERDGDAWVDPLPAGWSRQGSFAVYTVGPLAKAACTPAAPLFTPASCQDGVPVRASVTAPPNSTAIRYQLQDTQGSVTVFATLEGNAVEWASPMPDEWRQLDATLAMFVANGLDRAPCIQTNLVSAALFPDMIEGRYDPGDSIELTPVLPASPGVSYAITGTASLNTTITVTAELQDGYDWPDALPEGWISIDEDTAVFRFVIDGDFDYAENPPPSDVPDVSHPEPTSSLVVTSLPTTGATAGGVGAATTWSLPLLLVATVLAALGGAINRFPGKR